MPFLVLTIGDSVYIMPDDQPVIVTSCEQARYCVAEGQYTDRLQVRGDCPVGNCPAFPIIKVPQADDSIGRGRGRNGAILQRHGDSDGIDPLVGSWLPGEF